jgi:hypothetical protein
VSCVLGILQSRTVERGTSYPVIFSSGMSLLADYGTSGMRKSVCNRLLVKEAANMVLD